MNEDIRAKYIANQINKLDGRLVLDIGCNSRLVEKYLVNKVYVGVDVLHNPTVIANVISLPFKDKSFKIINLSEVLEHLRSPMSALIEIKRVLADDGLLLLDVPNPYGVEYVFEWFLRKNSLKSCDHLSLFGINEIFNLSERCGMKCEYLCTRFVTLPTFTRNKGMTISVSSRFGGYNYFMLRKDNHE